jgi:hypothetical protein
MSRSTRNSKTRNLNNNLDRLIQTALPQTWKNQNQNSIGTQIKIKQSSTTDIKHSKSYGRKMEVGAKDDIDEKSVDSDYAIEEFKDGCLESTAITNQPTGSFSSSVNNNKYIQTTVNQEDHLNLPFGDCIMDEKQGCTILFHNINGMKDNKNWYQILATMKDLNVDIFGFTEVN